MTTAFAGSEVVFVCVEPLHRDGIEDDEHLVVPAAVAAKAGFPHDLVVTELAMVEPVTPAE
jgi:hypothetical protein